MSGMIEMLRDLHAHQEWADAEHWRAFERHPMALRDATIRTRLHHIHLTERAFLSLARGEPIVPARPEDFPSAAALRDWARAYHEEARAFLKDVGADRLEETLVIPWFKEPPIRVTVAQAMTQGVMHSHYHRGQNATRLRELGWKPPLTDLIVWYWKDRPAASWSPAAAGR